MDLHELLDAANAPDEIVQWVRVEGLDFESAWERCARADHRLWLAASGGVPIEQVIEAAAAAVMTFEAQASATLPRVVSEALMLAISGASASELAAVAESCEHIADGGLADYRSGGAPLMVTMAGSVALVVRAAEALIAGEARREAVRLERARAIGANLGIGMQSVLPQRDGPARLNIIAAASDPAQGSFLFCVAACAQAVLILGEAKGAELRALDRVVERAFAITDE